MSIDRALVQSRRKAARTAILDVMALFSSTKKALFEVCSWLSHSSRQAFVEDTPPVEVKYGKEDRGYNQQGGDYFKR